MTTKLTWFGHAAIGLETNGHARLVIRFSATTPPRQSSRAVAADTS